MESRVRIPQDELVAFCEKYPIRRLSLFGSVLRDDFGPESDIDVLVEFEPGAPVTYFDMAEMESELGAILGRHVDLREPEELSASFRQRVFNTAAVCYERT